MRLAPRDLDKLNLHLAGSLAQKRLWRGLRLNYPEAVALIAAQLLEFIRDGQDVVTLMETGKRLLGYRDVMPGIAGLIPEVQIEGTFPDGTKLVTVHEPICRSEGDRALALYGSGFSIPGTLPSVAESEGDLPGDFKVEPGDIELNSGRISISIPVTNTGDRPIQVGSHYPFFESNPALKFDRRTALDKRLDIPSGLAVRFEPGETKSVSLISIAGERQIFGGNALVSGSPDGKNGEEAMARMASQGFGNSQGTLS